MSIVLHSGKRNLVPPSKSLVTMDKSLIQANLRMSHYKRLQDLTLYVHKKKLRLKICSDEVVSDDAIALRVHNWQCIPSGYIAFFQ